MGRSVSTPSGAIGIVYLHREEEDPYGWPDFIEDIRNIIRRRYPSFTDIDSWLGREDRVILENGLALVTVSEYCGLVAICLVPQTDLVDYPELALSWCERYSGYWEKYIESRFTSSALRKIGTASNGEAFFEKVG